MHLSRVWNAQCLAKRFWISLNSSTRKFDGHSILFLWKMVCRTWQQQYGPRVRKIPRLSFQNCLAVSPIFSRATSFSLSSIKLKAPHRKFDGNIILQLWKTDCTNPEQAVDGYLKKVVKINKLPSQSTSHTHKSLDRKDWSSGQEGSLKINFQDITAAQLSPP